MRIVLDTNIIVSGLFWSGTPGKIMNAWNDNKFQVVLTDSDGNAPDFDPESDPDILRISLKEVEDLAAALDSVTPESDIAIAGTSEELADQTFDIFNRIDSTLNTIASYRATLGSVQARLNSTITNIHVSTET